MFSSEVRLQHSTATNITGPAVKSTTKGVGMTNGNLRGREREREREGERESERERGRAGGRKERHTINNMKGIKAPARLEH